MRFNKAQIIIIGVLLGLVGILVYLNYKSSASSIEPSVSIPDNVVSRTFDFDAYLSGLKDSLSPEALNNVQEQTKLAFTENAGVFSMANLARTWDSLNFRLVSAFYLTKIAVRINDENTWFKAGLKYYEFAATCQDTAMQIYASKQAIIAFEKVVALNENNIEAKNALAICYIQNDIDMMKGVQLLKDVTRRDSFNIDANYTLGMLSMRSGQVDKAAQRFETLVKIQPLNAEFHYYLGQAYSQLGKKQEAINAFQTFKSLVHEDEAKKNIDVTINNLKKSK